MKEYIIYLEDLEKAQQQKEEARIKYIEDTARAEGRAEGIAIGRAERIRSIARKMLSMGMSDEDVLECTKLSQEEINKIKTN